MDAERDGNRVIYALRDRRMIEAVNVLREVMNDEVARRHALRSRGAVRARS